MAYNLLRPIQIVTNGSMATSITGPAIETKQQDNIGFQLNWTGTPTGTFSFQVSMDYAQDIEGNVTNAGNWITLTVSPAITATGAADIAYVDLNQLSAPYARVVYTAVSGSGTLNAFITAKAV